MVRLGAILVIAAAAVAAIPLLAQKGDAMTRYEWLPTESAPEAYPVEILSGNMLFAGGDTLYIPDARLVNNGWGNFGSTHIVGDPMKPLPTGIELTWYSFVEDRFWGGTFDLPVDRLSAMFGEGVASRHTGKQVTYEDIIVGMAPEGHVSVWVGAEDFVHEVTTFMAEPKEIEWEAYQGDSTLTKEQFIAVEMTEAMGADEAERQLESGIRNGQYALYKTQMPWRIEVEGSDMSQALWLTTFNGEKDYFDLTGPMPDRAERAAPLSAVLEWGPESGGYSARIGFDEKEIYAALEKMLGSGKGAVSLAFEIADTNRTVALSLRNDTLVLPLEKVKVKVYSK